MNIPQEIYKQLLQKAGSEKAIKGLTSTQKKAWRVGYVNPTLSSVKHVLVENGLSATIFLKSEATESTLTIL